MYLTELNPRKLRGLRDVKFRLQSSPYVLTGASNVARVLWALATDTSVEVLYLIFVGASMSITVIS